MKFLLDTHFLSNDVLRMASKRTDLYVIEAVLDEHTSSFEEGRKIMKAGIKVLSLNAKHFERLLRVLEKHGDNFDLIRLFTAEGTADVLMLAFIIAESEEGAELFPEKWTLVTKDTGLLAAAKDYGITCTSELI